MDGGICDFCDFCVYDCEVGVFGVCGFDCGVCVDWLGDFVFYFLCVDVDVVDVVCVV